MAIQILDSIGTLLQNLTGVSPEYVVLLIGLGVALYRPLKRGYLDNRFKSLLEEMNYSTGVLTASFLLAYYYQYGGGIGPQLIGIAGGFVLGTFVVTTINKLTGFK